jgi:hypothetical protein
MLRSLLKSPEHLASEWPEVFENLYINSLPIGHIELIKLEFINGQLWEIDISNYLKKNKDAKLVTDMLFEIFYEYNSQIKKIDFKINIKKLKKDIKQETKKIM